MRFEFSTSNRIIFGPGSIVEIQAIVATLGKKVLVVTDSIERTKPLVTLLQGMDRVPFFFQVGGEPSIEIIDRCCDLAKEIQPAFVIGFGGGSALDTGKTVSALFTNQGDVLDHLEVIGKGIPFSNPPLTYIAIPTTAGTGSEVTRNAVIFSEEHKLKASLRSPFLLPKVALVDPELTASMPPSLTATTGLDALTQLIEPFVCNNSNPVTDSFCRDGILRTRNSLKKAYDHGEDQQAREDMALASLLGGLALANARLGAVHGLANPLGGISHIPHGNICARLLPLVMESNHNSLQTRSPASPLLERYHEIGRILTGDPEANALEGISWIKNLCSSMDILPLSQFNIHLSDLPAVVGQAQKASSMKGNPVKLSDRDLFDILEKAL